MRASWMAVKKLSGVAVPSCSCGSSQRDAKPACHASTSLPLDAARAGEENGTSVEAVASTIKLTASQGNKLCASNRGNFIQSLRSGDRSGCDECCRLARDPHAVKYRQERDAAGSRDARHTARRSAGGLRGRVLEQRRAHWSAPAGRPL